MAGSGAASLTVSARFRLRSSPSSLLATRSKLYAPGVTAPVLPTMSWLVPGGVTGFTVKLLVAPAGSPLVASVAGSLKPSIELTTMSYTASSGEQTARDVGETPSRKVGPHAQL